MSIIETIENQLASHAVVLYMKGTPDFPQCGFSNKAVQVLNACGADFFAVNILEDMELREALKQYSNWPTYPQLYIKGELIGGCDIMIDAFNKGDLQKQIQAAQSL